MRKRILVIDDNRLILAIARDALQEAGFDVDVASNGIEANRYIFSRSRPDLIILDIMMPMLDGHEKAKILKDNELSREIPILLMSSKDEAELRRLTSEAGAEGYLLKPFSPIEVTAGVRKILGRGQL